MCGISCIISLDRSQGHAADCLGEPTTLAKQLDDSLELIKHRGPDSRGQWISPDNKVGTLSLRFAQRLQYSHLHCDIVTDTSHSFWSC
jgi:asparagine synthase (glutamine-hydrolysing)